ncbi:MAG: hypothetical protein ABR958_09075 [Dehalococcoidales bacterium]
MFSKKKDREKEKREKEKLVRRVLGKDSQRRVFGFQCSPKIQASLKSLSDQIHVPLFALAEHALQLGAMQLEEVNNNPEEREELRRHICEVHIEMRVIEKVARYDAEAADVLKMERIRRFSIDKATRQLVVKYMRLGLKPEELEEMILFGHHCRLAIAQGWPRPPEISPKSYSHRPPNTITKNNPDESENKSPE